MTLQSRLWASRTEELPPGVLLACDCDQKVLPPDCNWSTEEFRLSQSAEQVKFNRSPFANGALGRKLLLGPVKVTYAFYAIIAM